MAEKKDSTKFAGERLLEVAAPILILVILGIFGYLGFFDKNSDVYDDLHPTSVFDIIGLILVTAFAVFVSGVWKKFVDPIWTDNTKGLGIAAWIAGATGIALIHLL